MKPLLDIVAQDVVRGIQESVTNSTLNEVMSNVGANALKDVQDTMWRKLWNESFGQIRSIVRLTAKGE